MRLTNHPLFVALMGLFAVCLLVASQPASHTLKLLEDRTFDVRNFDRLDLGSAFTINVRQASGFSVRLSGRAEDINDLEARVSGGTLKIESKNRNWWKNRQRVQVDITMPALRGAHFGGASSVNISGFRNQGKLDLDVSGASTVTMAIDADELNVEVSGASTAKLAGRADRIQCDVSGASSLRASDLVSKTTKVDASGASNASLYVTTNLTAEASGASSVRYKGNANLVKNTSGAGSVRAEN